MFIVYLPNYLIVHFYLKKKTFCNILHISLHITMMILRLITLLVVLCCCNHGILVHAFQCNIQGVCVDSNVIGYYESSDIAHCKNYCRDVSECTWYLYHQDAQNCILYSECSKIVTRKSSYDIQCFFCILNQRECEIDPSLQCNIRHSVLKYYEKRLQFWEVLLKA